VPIRQGLAVTGSVDQFGNIQAIGGVNEKIEGFFEVCRSRGLNRRQGVLIPRANLPHLMLRQDVQDAVARGRFHLWAIGHVDEGLEILTGMPAGRPRSDGRYARTTVNGQVQQRLERMAEDLRDFADGGR
jgi:predicted ATP-dependent protease